MASPRQSDDARLRTGTIGPTADSARSYETLITGRTCGACRVCCRLPDIPELGKPINTWCPHADLASPAGGCGIYDERPRTCREYECAWLSGLGDEQDRPDRLGVMYQPITLPDGSPGLAAVEAIDGAFERPRVRAQLDRYAQAKPGRIVMRTAEEARFRPVPLTVGRTKPASQAEPKPSLARLARSAGWAT